MHSLSEDLNQIVCCLYVTCWLLSVNAFQVLGFKIHDNSQVSMAILLITATYCGDSRTLPMYVAPADKSSTALFILSSIFKVLSSVGPKIRVSFLINTSDSCQHASKSRACVCFASSWWELDCTAPLRHQHCHKQDPLSHRTCDEHGGSQLNDDNDISANLSHIHFLTRLDLKAFFQPEASLFPCHFALSNLLIMDST